MNQHETTRAGAPPTALPESERVDERSLRLHKLTSDEVVDLFAASDGAVVATLRAARTSIARLGDAMADALERGGRIIYLGAGTSGRLGCLDAAEWPPTFGVSPARVVAILAGGAKAFERSVEGAEDRAEDALLELRRIGFCSSDVLVAISASGGAPFVLEALRYARELNAPRALVSANDAAPVGADSGLLRVVLATGREVVAGSTRLKAAVATHLALQRAGNVCAVRCGWVYAGRMVEMRPTNQKLLARAERIVVELGEVTAARAAECLAAARNDIKVAIVMARFGVEPSVARERLDAVRRRLDALPGFDGQASPPTA
ncbi:MAG: N-acetylmuramic acid 6-phosphate etherase [Planctomycetota bacterium]